MLAATVGREYNHVQFILAATVGKKYNHVQFMLAAAVRGEYNDIWMYDPCLQPLRAAIIRGR